MKNFLKENKLYLISTPLLLLVGAGLYFLAKIFNSSYHLIGSPYDDLIPFMPVFIYPYMIWYPFSAYALFLIFKADLKTYIRAAITIGLSFLSSSIIFVLYPTQVNRPIVESYDNLTSFITYLTFRADTPPVNCLPSNHCLLCFIIIFSMAGLKQIARRKKALVIMVNLLIIASTLLVKQHVIYDLLAALALSGFYYYRISYSFIRF